MALDEKLTSKQKPSAEELDVKIAVLMAEDMIAKGGYEQVVAPALKTSRDPGQVVGQFMLQLGQEIMENMPEDMKLSPEMLLSEGGWVEQISDLLQDKYNVKKEVMDKAEIYVASTATQMAEARNGDPSQAPMAAGQPPQEAMQAPAEAQEPMLPQGAV